MSRHVVQQADKARLLAAMFNQMGEQIAALDTDYRYVSFNTAYQQEFESIWGHPVREGMSLIEALADFPDDLKTTLKLLGRALKGESFTNRITFKGNKPCTFETSIYPLREEDGEITGAILVSRDIKEKDQAEKRFEAIFDNTFQFTGLLDPAGTLLEANETALNFAALKREDVIGKPFWECYWWTISTETQLKLKDSVQRVARGEFIRYEVKVLNAEGIPVPLDFSLKPIRDNAGDIILLVPEGRVITEQVEARAELEQLFETTFEQAAVGIAHVAENGSWLRLNEKFCNILGYAHAELMGKSFQDVTYPTDLDKDLALFQRLKAGELSSYSIEKRYIRKDGTLVWINLTASIVWSSKGKFKYAIAVVEDIKGRKEAEAHIRMVLHRQKIASKLGQEALSGTDIKALFHKTGLLLLRTLQVDYVAILEHSPDTDWLTYSSFQEADRTKAVMTPSVVGFDSLAGYTLLMDEPIIVSDYSTEIRFTPLPFIEALGIQSAISVIISGPSPETPFGVLIAYCKTDRDYNAEVVNFLQSVANIMAIAISRKEFESKIQAFNLELERRVLERTEQLENANKQKSRILAMVSHDFKTPLAAIGRFIEILQRQVDRMNPDQAELIGYINDATAQLRNLVTDILDRARIESGQVKPLKEEVVISDFIHNMLPPLQALAEERNIHLLVEISPDANDVQADPVLLRQVLVNLISNAIKYNRPGGKIFCRVFTQPENLQIVFQVEDTGLGIPQDKLDMVFTDFYRIKPKMGEIEGTGLGLASAKKLVELHGGSIEVDSREGIGSIFSVRLPKD